MNAAPSLIDSWKGYIRDLFALPPACFRAKKLFGLKGMYLPLCTILFKRKFFDIELPPFWHFKTQHEILNFTDNFCDGELRDGELEAHLKKTSHPVILDLGINIGITVRWWLSLNKSARIIGIDMIQEALDYTSKELVQIKTQLGNDYIWTPICSGIGVKTGDFDLKMDNPLEGMNSLDSTSGKIVRHIHVDTVDALLASQNLDHIDLLKIDIEGHAGYALQGATETLKKVKYIVIESHNREEIVLASSILADAHFCLFRVHGRTMWWISRK